TRLVRSPWEMSPRSARSNALVPRSSYACESSRRVWIRSYSSCAFVAACSAPDLTVDLTLSMKPISVPPGSLAAYCYRMSPSPRGFAMVLAGGEGKRLQPLTADRAKPAVPFGGNFRLVDFALSNLVNAGFLRIAVLTQYKSHSLDRHIATSWRLSPLLGNYVTPVPAQMRRGPRWFAGSADAIYQNMNLIADERPDYICVFGADHIYRMDPRQMVAQHLESGAGVTVAGIRVPIEQASDFGVIETAADGKTIAAFREKPADPTGLPDAPDQVFASMGNYVFTTRTLVESVTRDAAAETSRHDLGGDIVPGLVERCEAY